MQTTLHREAAKNHFSSIKSKWRKSELCIFRFTSTFITCITPIVGTKRKSEAIRSITSNCDNDPVTRVPAINRSTKGFSPERDALNMNQKAPEIGRAHV